MRRLICVALLLCAAPAGALDLIAAHRAAVENDAAFAAEVSAADAGREYAVQSRAMMAPRVNLTGSAGKLDMETRATGDMSSLFSSDTDGKTYGYGLSLTRPLYRPDLKADARNLAAQAEIAALTFKGAQQDLILRVAQAYFACCSRRTRWRSPRHRRKRLPSSWRRPRSDSRVDAPG